MAFLATFDVNILVPTDPIVFNVVVLNPGGHYDATSGIYTVPLDGTYQFIINVWTYAYGDIRPILVVDGQRVSLTLHLVHILTISNIINFLSFNGQLV